VSETLADSSLVESIDGFFTRRVSPELAAEVERTGTLPAETWHELEGLGFTLVGISEEAGGSGGSLLDALAILIAAGAHAAPLPLVETYAAAWLLEQGGIAIPAGPLTFVAGSPDDTLRCESESAHGTAYRVPWGRGAVAVSVVTEDPAGWRVTALDPAQATLTPGVDLAGTPSDALTFDGPGVIGSALVSRAEDPRWRLTLARTAQLAGALSGVLGLTVRYTGEREQFGRPIRAFQGVQEHIVTIAEAAEITTMSVWRAALASRERASSFEIASAKLVATESALASVRAAHQAHGAIGMTREYPLHLYTRRLHAWRQELGTELALSGTIGHAVRESGSVTRPVADDDHDVEVRWSTT
jgi:acyl-CoA dehydrogenase